MYIKLIDRCNLACAHCQMDAPRRGGGVLAFDRFMDAVKHASNHGDHLTLGGGEPTLHPQFGKLIEWLGHFSCKSDLDGIYMITNGTRAKPFFQAVGVQEWIGPEKFHIEVSANDGFHDDTRIAPAVWDWIKRGGKGTTWNSGQYVRTRAVTRILPVGRAVENEVATEPENDCYCADHFVRTNGDVSICACPDAPVIGHVWDKDLSRPAWWTGDDGDLRCWQRCQPDYRRDKGGCSDHDGAEDQEVDRVEEVAAMS